MTIEYLGIGTPEDALRSCLKLFSRLFEVPEAEVRGYLDMYYQLRLRVEEGERIATPVCAQTSLECRALPARQNARNDGDDGGRQIAQTSSECRTLPARQNAPTVKDEAAVLETSQSALPTAPPKGEPSAEPEPEPEPLRENRIKRPGGKGKPRPSSIGNTRGHDAAVFKRQVRDRLEALRKKGVSAPELIKAAPDGSVKESDIYLILQGHVIKIDIYRALDEALRHFEN